MSNRRISWANKDFKSHKGWNLSLCELTLCELWVDDPSAHTPRRRADLSAHPFWEEGIHGKKTHHVKPGNLGFSNKKHPSSPQRLTTQSFLWTKNRKHTATSLASKMNPIRTSFHHAPYSCLTKSQNPKKLMGEMSPFYRWLLDLYCASSPGSCNSIEESLPKAWMARLDGKWETPAGMEGWSFLSLWI